MENNLKENIQDLIKVGTDIQKSMEQFNVRSNQLIEQTKLMNKKQPVENVEGITIPKDLFFKTLQGLSYTQAMGAFPTDIYNELVQIAIDQKNAVNTVSDKNEQTTQTTQTTPRHGITMEQIEKMLANEYAKKHADIIKEKAEKEAAYVKANGGKAKSTIDFADEADTEETDLEEILRNMLASSFLGSPIVRFLR